MGYDKIIDMERRMLLPKTIENPEFTEDGDEPKLIANPDYVDPQTGREIINSVKWRLSKLQPKLYGDRLELAGQVATTPLSDQAPAWLKEGIADRARAAEEGAVPDKPTVH